MIVSNELLEMALKERGFDLSILNPEVKQKRVSKNQKFEMTKININYKRL